MNDEEFAPLPSLIDADFEHDKLPEFGLPRRYSDIDWKNQAQRDGYVLFVIWFLEQLLRDGALGYSDEERPEVIALHAQLDQLHAEMRENAILAGLSISASPAPFAELESDD